MGTYAMTGGATGIGAAVKKRLIDEGHRVIVVDIKEADIAAAVMYLLSSEASFVCGSVLFVDGGHDAMLRPDSI